MMGRESIFYIKKIWGRPIFAALIFFVVLFAFLAAIFAISAGDPVPDDEYFHFRYAHLLRTEGLDAVKNFDWIYLSGHADGGSRYAANLYQVVLIPFTFFDDQTLGLHIAIAFLMSGAIAIFYYILRKERVAHPLLYTFLLLTSTYFVTRLLLGRAFIFLPFIMLFEMYFAINRRYIPLFVVVLFHVLWHQSTYFFPLIVVGIVEAARFIVARRLLIKNIILTLVAIVCGMAFFPGFPHSLIQWFIGLFFIQNSSNGAASGSLGGAEMITKDFMTYFVGQEFFFFAFVTCIATTAFFYLTHRNRGDKKMVIPEKKLHWIYALFMLLIFVTYGATAINGRFFDLALPIVIAFFAMSVTAIVQLNMFVIDGKYRLWAGIIVWTWVLMICLNTAIYIYARSNMYDYTPAGKAAQWIADHSEGREKVFLHNWGNFSLMFFGNTHNIYSTGIEPATLKTYDERLYWIYYNMLAHYHYCDKKQDCRDMIAGLREYVDTLDPSAQEKYMKSNSENIIRSIREDFDASFILSDSKNFDDVILKSPEHIEKYYTVSSDKFNGAHMQFTVFKLK